MATLIIGTIIIGAMVFVAYKEIKKFKNGITGSCGGGCAGCNGCSSTKSCHGGINIEK